MEKGQAYEVLSKEFLYIVMTGLALRTEIPSNDTKSSCACCGHPCHFHEHESYEEWHDCKLVYSFD